MKKLYATLFILAAFGLTACGNQATDPAETVEVSVSTEPEELSAEVEEPREFTEEDLTDLVTFPVSDGDTIYVYQNAILEAEDVSTESENPLTTLLLDNVDYKDSVINSVTVDTSKVNVEEPGSYVVTFTVTADEGALSAYLDGTMNLEDKTTYTYSGDEVSVEIDKVLTIVNDEEIDMDKTILGYEAEDAAETTNQKAGSTTAGAGNESVGATTSSGVAETTEEATTSTAMVTAGSEEEVEKEPVIESNILDQETVQPAETSIVQEKSDGDCN